MQSQRGRVMAGFDVKSHGIDMVFDPVTQQQLLAFKFALHVSLPQLLQQLLEFQRTGAVPPTALSEANVTMATPPINPPVNPPVIPSQGITQTFTPPIPTVPPGVNVDIPLGNTTNLAIPAPSLQPPFATPQSVPPPMYPAEMPLNDRLLMALRESNLAEVRNLIQQQADVNFIEHDPQAATPLHHALESGGNIDIVNCLVQARASVNATCRSGSTPLHYAIQQYSSLAPTVIRLLLCAKGDLLIPDGRGNTPLDSAKTIALQSRPSSRLSACARQLLSEVTEQPTVAVSVIDAKEVRSALFGDTQNDRIVFYTESSMGLYSLNLGRVIFTKKLRQLQITSFQHLAVNPWLGTVAVCLEIEGKGEADPTQHACIIWPHGQFQDEEPLKLRIQVGSLEGRNKSEMLPANVVLSKSSGPQMLVSRLCDGQVFCWQLNVARCQVVSEKKLTSRGGLIAASNNGFWMAIVNQEVDNGGQVDIWTYETATGRKQDPSLIMNLKKRPACLCVTESNSNTSCFLALVEEATPGAPLPPIEVFNIDLDNNVTSVYRVRPRALCQTLSFCHGPDALLLSGDADGLIRIHDHVQNKHSMYHDNPGVGSICISVDSNLIVTTEANYFRVFKAPHSPS